MQARAYSSFIPAAKWLRDYRRDQLSDDLLAGFITAVLLVPQGMAYAILAGLPPEVGLYASILPPIIYALLGTSRTLSVGPVSVAALLVANALAGAGADAASRLGDALLLAAMSGALLLLLAILRLDVLVNFISHPVLSGFTSGAALLIILSQMQNLFGISVPATGSGAEMVLAAVKNVTELNLSTAVLGFSGIVLIVLAREPLVSFLSASGLSRETSQLLSRAGPLVVIALLTVIVITLDLQQRGVAVVGTVPAGLPELTLDFLQLERAAALFPSAIMIALIGFVESISVAKVLGHRRRQKVDSNQELIALGAANIGAAVSGGMPVAGGFSRSIVNFSAGAQTQLAAIITALSVAVVALFFTPLFYHMPKAALAAIIVVAVIGLFNWRELLATYQYDRADGLAALITFTGVLLFDIEVGLLLGIALGLGAFLWRSSRPHVAIVGRLPGTEHFRNVDRYTVETWPRLLLLRVDRSLFFANVGYVEETIAAEAAERPELEHLVVICSAVNGIDYSALEALEQLATALRDAGITLHMAEVKGPVMDRLKAADVDKWLSPGQVFLSTEKAVEELQRSSDASTPER